MEAPPFNRETSAMTTTERNIIRLRERIQEAESDLARAGKFRIGTLWHSDRVRELDSLRQTLARLESAVE